MRNLLRTKESPRQIIDRIESEEREHVVQQVKTLPVPSHNDVAECEDTSSLAESMIDKILLQLEDPARLHYVSVNSAIFLEQNMLQKNRLIINSYETKHNGVNDLMKFDLRNKEKGVTSQVSLYFKYTDKQSNIKTHDTYDLTNKDCGLNMCLQFSIVEYNAEIINLPVPAARAAEVLERIKQVVAQKAVRTLSKV